MESKRVGLVAVAAAAMVLVSPFFNPTAFAVRHKNYDSNDGNEVASVDAEPGPVDYYDNIMVKDESSRSTGSKRLKVDDGCPSSVCDMTKPCKIGCICVPFVPFPIGTCVGICCQINPPPGAPPLPPSSPSPSPSLSPVMF
ncbi:hypothetical protein RchiOBHm_Chr1g0363911 [Rosa chinensis]|uniref:Uncharacterized protein n=1 Tax=Rosa chinensis TaxID=74649 RepID=A0A2P6SJK5_ROSCH|nr:hypothetical protein RchiOBHm_Chr1g0363911 [Rosa chinensis]